MSLVGMAFTSPTVPTLIISRQKFHLYLFSPADVSHPDFQVFLSQQDGRAKVLLVTSVNHLNKVLPLQGKIRSYIVFDSPSNLTQIGAKIVDCQALGDGWKMKQFSVAELDTLLEQSTEIVQETLTEAAAKEESVMPELTQLEGAEEGTLRAMLYKLLTTGVVPQGFVAQLVQYQCGLTPKRTWTFQIKKPALRGGSDPVVMTDLERYVEGRYGIRIHRAVYAHLILKKPADEAIREFRANEGDVKFCLELLPNKAYADEEFVYKPSFA